ncbi:MAG: UDP-2,4-diacetamido-2,4,6-trideoxy-beta-L-altropyranose hydrolase [Lachnospiraceae bacterium]|nr:UDP-2,4-diacetamido-2,4,6-trideoxy-beta-L-altropyranose hydrolase [Lachnospiraceae bacterium]
MILFYAEAGPETGSGHVMRSLSIAEASEEKCIFISFGREASDMVSARGYETERPGCADRAAALVSLVTGSGASVLFVDDYDISPEGMQRIKNCCEAAGCLLVYMDDLFRALPCHVLVNYNIYAERDAYEKLYAGGELPRLLLGPGYAPLRKEFSEAAIRKIPEKAGKILISAGGADPAHISLELLKRIAADGREYAFVIGALNPDKEEIYELAGSRSNVRLYENVNNMSELMSEADLAISAAGSTLYELCATGCPALTYVLADNQKAGAEGFAERGLMEYCGDSREEGSGKLAEKLLESAASLAEDKERRLYMSTAMRDVSDGKGAGRILEEVFDRKGRNVI